LAALALLPLLAALTLLASLPLLTALALLALLALLTTLTLLGLTLLALTWLLTWLLACLLALALALLLLALLTALALLAGLLALTRLLAGPLPEARGLFQPPAQILQLSERAIEALIVAVTLLVAGQLLGVAHFVSELFERTGHGIFAASDVGRGALTDVFGSDTQPGGHFVLLQFDERLADGAGSLTLLVAHAANGFLHLAFEVLQLFVHGPLLLCQIAFLLAGEAARQTAAATGILAFAACFFEGLAQGFFDLRRNLLLLLG
jgi:hypothetical protein